jgi:WD40 repeat protein
MSDVKGILSNIGVLTDKGNSVITFAFNSTGTLLATCHIDWTVKLWDTSSHECVATLDCHNDYVHDPANEDDWEYNEFDPRDRMERERGMVTTVAFHPTDPLIMATGSDDRTARLWQLTSEFWMDDGNDDDLDNLDWDNLESGYTYSATRLATLVGHSHEISSVAFNPTGTLLATCGNEGTVKLWDTSSHECAATLEMHGNRNVVAFDPMGTLLATGGNYDAVSVWDTRSHALVATWETGSMNVTSIAFDPMGTLLASGSSDGTVKLWDTISHARVATLDGHSGSVHSAAFHPTAPVLAIGSENTMKLWDTRSHKCAATLVRGSHVVAFDPIGTILATSNGGPSVHLWDCSILSSKKQREMALMREMQSTLARRMTAQMPRRAADAIVGRAKGLSLFPQEKAAKMAAKTAKAAKASSIGGSVTHRHRKRRKHAKTKRHRKLR